MKKLFVTGGAGFIGTNLITRILKNTDFEVLNFDKLTYAGNLNSIEVGQSQGRYRFVHADICDAEAVSNAVAEFKPDAIVHLAAESHVDRSITSARQFIETNVVGTGVLLDVACGFWKKLSGSQKEIFRFLHVSTDEVFGSALPNEKFKETTAYDPKSPYSASKASSDHLVRAWGNTYGMPYLITNCSNNYGPYQYPEKLIPVIINKAMQGQFLPVYGDGLQIRDWLHVDDHADAILRVLQSGKKYQSFNIGGNNELTNLEIVKKICGLLDTLIPNKPRDIVSFGQLIQHIQDRPGHDRRYAVDSTKISEELHWSPSIDFETGLQKTIDWYVCNPEWLNPKN